ncbi:MAG: GyrI-like domain-containing protein [bacterium]
MKLDYKKLEKEYYNSKKPTIINVKKMNFITFDGRGNPGSENSDFTRGIGLLYSTAYTLSMSYKSDYKIKDFEQFVVAPLEGYWYQEGIEGYDPTRKDLFVFKLMIRMPEFITKEDFIWAIDKISKKKNLDYSEIKYDIIEEGLCVQALHIGSYDSGFETTKLMHDFIEDNGYQLDFSNLRHHHEIYISDNRKTHVDKLKTILRHPIKKKER